MTAYKKLSIFGYIMFALLLIFAFMPMLGIKSIGGVQPGWFGVLALGILLFSGGFFNLMGYRKNINKFHNILMMTMLFLGGILIFVVGVYRITGELHK